MSITTETKVGILVLAAAAGLGWLSYQSGNLSSQTGHDMRPLQTEMQSATGLRIGTKVRRAGVDVGEVTDIYLNDDGNAVVVMRVRDDMNLPANLVAQIASDGLVGEKFVALSTDFAPKGTLPEQVTNIPSKGASTLDDVASNFGEITNDLKMVSSSLRNALGGPENAAKISRIVDNLEAMSSRMGDIMTNEIEDGKINNIVNNFSDFSDGLKDADTAGLIKDMRAAAASLNRILSSNEGTANELFDDLHVTAANLAKITTRLEKGEGTLGKLLTEDDILDDMKVAMADFREFSEKINKGEGSIGRLVNDGTTVDKLNSALDNFSSLNSRIESFQTEVDFNGYTLLSEDDIAKGNFTVTLRPRPGRYYVLGVQADGFVTTSERTNETNSYQGQDFGDDMKLTAQFGHVYQSLLWGKDVGMRVGLKNSSFGLGVDTAWLDDRMELALDAYDFAGENSGNSSDDPHVDVTARYMLLGRSLYVTGGMDNMLNDRYSSPFVGLGLRFADDDLKYLASTAL